MLRRVVEKVLSELVGVGVGLADRLLLGPYLVRVGSGLGFRVGVRTKGKGRTCSSRLRKGTAPIGSTMRASHSASGAPAYGQGYWVRVNVRAIDLGLGLCYRVRLGLRVAPCST